MKRWNFLPLVCAMILMGSLTVPNPALAQQCCVVPGDANESGTVTSADVIFLVNHVFKGDVPPACFEHGDVNQSGTITSADIISLVNFVFKGGTLPDCIVSGIYVFIDDYGPEVTYEAFGGSFLAAVQLEADSVYAGTQGLSITIESAGYSGGAFTDSTARDLTQYNALTFWAKASQAASFNVAGIGNDNTGTSKYTAEVVVPFALTTTWQQYVIPIPLAEKLVSERGHFYFAEGSDEGAYTIWIDEIIFDSLTTITNPRPAFVTQTIDLDSGATIGIGNGTVTFDVDGSDIDLSAMPGYFTFASSDSSVASIDEFGVITGAGQGTATITAQLGAVAATGVVTVNVGSAEAVPAGPAPTPTQADSVVISLFSDAYTNVPVDTWLTPWSDANQEDYLIGSDSTKKYTNLVFAGIEFFNPEVDASTMTHFHMDIWTPDPTANPAVFKIKLVNDVFGTVSESELTFNDASTPPLVTEGWVSFDIPLSAFTGLTGTGNLGQLIISGDPNTVYVDNVYFYDSGVPTEPLTSAPTPTEAPSSVISLFSDAYTNVPVDTWSAGFDLADVEDFLLVGDSMKKYTNFIFAGIEFLGPNSIDADSMTHFRLDYWTSDPTSSPAVFKIKLVDFGADNAFGGGDDVDHELTFNDVSTPPLVTGNWVSFDIPLTDFTGLTTQANLSQLILVSDPGPSTVFIDNVYFYGPAPTEPPVSAPTPTSAPGDVISLFSDAYTNVVVDTWSAGFDNADVADFLLVADSMKKYTNFVFAGIEFLGPNSIDADSMTHFHMDYWTPDATVSPAVFKIKLVDFGADNAFGGGDDVEHELVFNDASAPPLVTGGWVSFDIPLTDFIGLTTQANLSQIILVSDPGPNTVFIDNVYFRK